MKSAFFALVLTLVSSSAFATSPELSCDQLIRFESDSIIAQANAFISDVQEMEQMQIQQDGQSSLGGDTLGRAERAREIIEVVQKLQQYERVESDLTAQLCEANLNVSAVLAK